MSNSLQKISNSLWFEDSKKDVFSQQGEDGIIEEIFSFIGTTNKYAIECGALNGIHDSCTRNLIINEGWQALLIEGDQTPYEQLVKNYQELPGTTCVHAFISFAGENSIDKLFVRYQVPKRPDLFVLDIDGNEYHIWDSMEVYRPRVMVIEFNPTIPNEVSFIQPKDMSVQQGSSLKALCDLATKKNYYLVALTDFNAFFVDVAQVGQLLQINNDLDLLRPHNPFETKLYQLYDGTLKISGYDTLFWHKKKIEEEKIQVLSPVERIFPNGINSNSFFRNLKYWVRKSPIYPLVKQVRKYPLFRRIVK